MSVKLINVYIVEGGVGTANKRGTVEVIMKPPGNKGRQNNERPGLSELVVLVKPEILEHASKGKVSKVCEATPPTPKL